MWIYNTCNFQCTGVLWGCVSKYIAFEIEEFHENGGIDAKTQPCSQNFFTIFFSDAITYASTLSAIFNVLVPCGVVQAMIS